MINWKCFSIGLLIVFFDLVIYIFLGLIILEYQDFYDESKGAYWSLESMTLGQKAAFIGWYIWYILNILIITYMIYIFLKKLRNRYSKKV